MTDTNLTTNEMPQTKAPEPRYTRQQCVEMLAQIGFGGLAHGPGFDKLRFAAVAAVDPGTRRSIERAYYDEVILDLGSTVEALIAEHGITGVVVAVGDAKADLEGKIETALHDLAAARKAFDAASEAVIEVNSALGDLDMGDCPVVDKDWLEVKFTGELDRVERRLQRMLDGVVGE